jgi:uncharacterized protein (DUF58 family)
VILHEPFLRKLERLSLVARRVRAGQAAGERRSTRRGTSVEFADYRDYTRGDDLRRVDWNIYARLERPYVKLFEEEEDLAVHVLLDGSGSMDWDGETRRQGDKGTRGQGESVDKWLYARRLAAALGYVALVNGDKLTVTRLPSSSGSSTSNSLGPMRGRGQALRVFEWLEGLEAGGTTDLNGDLRGYALSAARPGLAVLISDLLSPSGYLEGLTALAARGHEVAVVHVLSPDEVEPPLSGDLRLLDVETGDPQEVSIDGGTRALYRRRLEAWRDEIRAACQVRGVHYVCVETDSPLERVMLSELRRVGLLK